MRRIKGRIVVIIGKIIIGLRPIYELLYKYQIERVKCKEYVNLGRERKRVLGGGGGGH
jgi:hypothetical protein